MINKYIEEDYEDITALGSLVNSDFAKLFKINNLPDHERIYVYKENDEVIGFVHILINIDDIEILNLVVKEDKRLNGIASCLIDHILNTPNVNIKRYILEVRKSNDAAINLYKKFNFFITGERKNYYSDDDAIIMERRND